MTFNVHTLNVDSNYHFTIESKNRHHAWLEVQKGIIRDSRARTGRGQPESLETIISITKQ